MRIFKIITALMLMLMLTSCVGEEPDNIAYITALGIDKSEDGYIYTIQFAHPVQISGGASESGGSGEDIVQIVAVEAPTLYSAINNADSIVSKELTLSHAKLFVISEETAAEGMEDMNDVFSRNNDIRPDIYIAIAEDAGKYLEEVQPVIELNPVKYYQLIYEDENGPAIPENTALDFFSASVSGSKDCLLPYAGVAEVKEEEKLGEKGEKEHKSSENKSQEEAKLNEDGFENGTKYYYAGQAGKKISNKSEVLGAAIFKDNKYIGKLGSTDAEIYNILENKFKEMNVTFYSDATPQTPITIKIEEKNAPKYDINKEEKHIDIYMKIEGELLSAPSEYRKDHTILELNKSASEMINKASEDLAGRLYRQYNTDALGIKGKLRRQFITNDAYYSYCSDFNPYEWSFSAYADVNIKRTGMTYYY
ncbi:MAG: Ger(x)C family spore germination protein [Oscillospiraceae bacterium]|nr:Ger(x)C family spore germination protein [Oscillospiraceae bacterium]